MQKTFCDICDSLCRSQVLKPVSRAVTSLNGARISVNAVFRYVSHPTGFGGPPDLCPTCTEEFLRELLTLNTAKEPPL